MRSVQRASVEDVGLDDESVELVIDHERRLALTCFATVLVGFEAVLKKRPPIERYYAEERVRRLPEWDQLADAYRMLRAAYVQPREEGRAIEHDPTLQQFAEERADFLDDFWGRKEPDGKRRFKGVAPYIAGLMRRYQKLHNKWHKRTPEYRETAAKRAKSKGLNKTEKAKAAKASWAQSEAGKAWWAKKSAERKAARAKGTTTTPEVQ
jgi:hypothetical protein